MKLLEKIQEDKKLLTLSISIPAILILIILALLIISFINSSQKGTPQALSPIDCKDLFMNYNNRELKIAGDNLIGSIRIRLDRRDCELSAKYIITFNTELPPNDQSGDLGNPYAYVLNLHDKSETSRSNYLIGPLEVVRQNQMTLPKSTSSSTLVKKFYNPEDEKSQKSTNSFYISYERTGYFSDKTFDKIINDNILEVIDASTFAKTESERASLEGEIVKTFSLIITE